MTSRSTKTKKSGRGSGATKTASTKTRAAKAGATKTRSSKAGAAKTVWQSRAVIRSIDAGNSAYCAHCDELIKFRAKVRAQQVICNVYVKGKWDRVEHYHLECYTLADSPFGIPPED